MPSQNEDAPLDSWKDPQDPRNVPSGFAGTSTKTVDLDCGIPMRRISNWLEEELSLAQDDRGRYLFSHTEPHGNAEGSLDRNESSTECHIAIEPLDDRTVGQVSIERTRLLASGDAEALDTFMRLFTLRFISAGG